MSHRITFVSKHTPTHEAQLVGGEVGGIVFYKHSLKINDEPTNMTANGSRHVIKPQILSAIISGCES